MRSNSNSFLSVGPCLQTMICGSLFSCSSCSLDALPSGATGPLASAGVLVVRHGLADGGVQADGLVVEVEA